MYGPHTGTAASPTCQVGACAMPPCGVIIDPCVLAASACGLAACRLVSLCVQGVHAGVCARGARSCVCKGCMLLCAQEVHARVCARGACLLHAAWSGTVLLWGGDVVVSQSTIMWPHWQPTVNLVRWHLRPLTPLWLSRPSWLCCHVCMHPWCASALPLPSSASLSLLGQPTMINPQP